MTEASTTMRTVDCAVTELQPPRVLCDPALGRTQLVDGNGNAVMQGDRAWCAVQQIAIDGDGRPVAIVGGRAGWYYDTLAAVCVQRVGFTAGAEPSRGALVHIACTAATAM
jgi:hypothetical protein